jgi:hypothetical protein
MLMMWQFTGQVEKGGWEIVEEGKDGKGKREEEI